MDKNHWLEGEWGFNPRHYAEELLLLLENAPDGQQKRDDIRLLSMILQQKESTCLDPPEEWDYAYHLHCRVEKAMLRDTRWEDWNKI